MGRRWNATDLEDDSLFRQAASLWRKRFAQLLWEHHYTQSAFKDRLNESLEKSWFESAPHMTQSDVSEWQNISTKKPGSEQLRRTLFPRLEVLLHIAEVLDTSVSYLIGETNKKHRDSRSDVHALENPENHSPFDGLVNLRDDDLRKISTDSLHAFITILCTSEFGALLENVARALLCNAYDRERVRKGTLTETCREKHLRREKQELRAEFNELMDVLFSSELPRELDRATG